MKTLKSKFQFNLILSAGLMTVHQIIIGCTYVFSSTLFAQLKQPTSKLKLTAEEASWIASIPIIICPIGLIITGVLMDKFGRRFTLQLAYIPLILSWIVLGFADSYKTILIGRIILGTTFGSGTCVFVYLAEVSSPERRPLFSAMLSVFVGVGNIAESALSVFFHWNTVSLMMAVASVAGCASLFLVPEPPAWLRGRGRVAEAEAAERWFGATATADGAGAGEGVRAADGTVAVNGGAPAAINGGAPAAINGGAPAAINGGAPADGGTAAAAGRRRRWWSPYARPTVWKPTLIGLGFFACQQCSGIYVMLFYSVDVLRDCGVPWDTSVVTVFLFSSRVISCVAYAALHWVPRKTLAVASCAGMTAALAVVVASMRLPLDDATRRALGPAVIAAFTLYVFSTQIGMLPMPWSLCGEVFPTDVKGTMSGVVQTCGFILMFSIIKIYPMMVLIFGIENVWTMFSLISLLSSLFCIFILPETKGIPFDVILAYFEPKKKTIQSTTNTSP